jgi:hypothetical protein
MRRCFPLPRLESALVRSTQPWHRTFLIIFTGQAFSLLGSSAVNFALVS